MLTLVDLAAGMVATIDNWRCFRLNPDCIRAIEKIDFFVQRFRLSVVRVCFHRWTDCGHDPSSVVSFRDIWKIILSNTGMAWSFVQVFGHLGEYPVCPNIVVPGTWNFITNQSESLSVKIALYTPCINHDNHLIKNKSVQSFDDMRNNYMHNEIVQRYPDKCTNAINDSGHEVTGVTTLRCIYCDHARSYSFLKISLPEYSNYINAIVELIEKIDRNSYLSSKCLLL
jgi:hypothetical protein